MPKTSELVEVASQPHKTFCIRRQKSRWILDVFSPSQILGGRLSKNYTHAMTPASRHVVWNSRPDLLELFENSQGSGIFLRQCAYKSTKCIGYSTCFGVHLLEPSEYWAHLYCWSSACRQAAERGGCERLATMQTGQVCEFSAMLPPPQQQQLLLVVLRQCLELVERWLSGGAGTVRGHWANHA